MADDKVVYACVPDLIRYYLGEEPILPNVPTYRCLDDAERRHVLDNLDELVVKPANETGGYGLFIGDRGHRRASWRRSRAGVEADPAQLGGPADRLAVDRADPVRRRHRPRHVDLRPFILSGRTQLRDPGRADPGGAARGLARRELVAGRRQQGHLGRRVPVTPGREPGGTVTHGAAVTRRRARCTGPPATCSGPRGPPGWSREHTDLLVDLPTSVPLTWEPLLAVTGPAQGVRRAPPRRADEQSVIRFLLSDRREPSSVLSCGRRAARENLRTAREVLPREAWQALNELYLYVTSHHVDGRRPAQPRRFLDKVIAESQRFTGIVPRR